MLHRRRFHVPIVLRGRPGAPLEGRPRWAADGRVARSGHQFDLLLSAGALALMAIFRRQLLPFQRRTRSAVTARRWRFARLAGVAVVALVLAFAGWQSLVPKTALAEIVPDAALGACLVGTMGLSDTSSKVSDSQLSDARTLKCARTAGNEPIQSLVGLERMPNLASLDLSAQRINDLSPLSNLNKLWDLRFTNNEVVDLSPLAALPVLTNLGLSNNQIMDISPLAQLPSLRFLGLAGNRIADIGALRGSTGLAELDLRDNQIVDVGPLSGLAQLETLTAAGNRISDPAPVSKLPVQTLDLSRNTILDIDSLENAQAVRYLTIGGNRFTDLRPLIGLPELLGVDLAGSDPAAMTGIEELRASGVSVGGLA